MKQQRGIALVELIIVLVILSGVMTWVSVFKSREHYDSLIRVAVDKLSEEIVLIQQFEAESAEETGSVLRFPSSPNALVVSGYVDACSLLEHNRGECGSVAYTTWGDQITYDRVDGEGDDTINTHLKITYPLTVFVDPDEAHKVARSMMQTLPFATYDSTAQEITIRVNRSNASVMMAGFITHDGSTELSDDWNIGGSHSIYNAKGVYVQTSAGTQQNLAAGTVASFSTTNGVQVAKPNCADGLTPSINTSIKALAGSNIQAMGASTSYWVDRGSYWQVYLQYRAQNSAGNWTTYSTGEIAVNVSCVQ